MPYADIPGVRLWFSDTAGMDDDTRTPVIFLHAASGTTDCLGEPGAGLHRCRVPLRRIRPAELGTL
ncbi:MAG: hypothetical protein Ct9H300mP11_31110 [Chloroflexota bacterium]|nr:MAG: hypothetical protein Ct9H300mP11_31110 [Chloroflexota bacterium]